MGHLFSTKDLESQRLGHSLGWSFVCFCYYLCFQMGNTPNLPVYLSPQMIKHRFLTRPNDTQEKWKNLRPYNNCYMDVYSSAIHYHEKVEMTQMSINWPRMNKMWCYHQWNII